MLRPAAWQTGRQAEVFREQRLAEREQEMVRREKQFAKREERLEKRLLDAAKQCRQRR